MTSQQLNPLRQPDLDPGAAILALQQNLDDTVRYFVQTLADFASLPHLPKSVEALLAGMEANSDNATLEVIRGGCNFIKFTNIIQSGELDCISQTVLDNLLCDPATIHFVSLAYNLPTDLKISSATFHKLGTTSYILKIYALKYGVKALKLIQYQYANHLSIANSTQQYGSVYTIHTMFAPIVHMSDSKWILMEFVEGLTLQEYLFDKQSPTVGDAAIVEKVAPVLTCIVNVLRYYSAQSPAIYHHDLNPMNIIVQEDGSGNVGVKLVDFGPNYVIRERLGLPKPFAQAYARTQLFIAPEILETPDLPAPKADLYSLGMLILEAVFEGELQSETVPVALQRLWKNPATTGLAKIVEDLIERDPAKRGLLLAATSDADRYKILAQTLHDDFKVYDDVFLAGQREFNEWYTYILGPIEGIASKVIEMIKIRRRLSGSQSRKVRRLTFWASVNLTCWSVIACFFFLYTVADVYVALSPNLSFGLLDNLIASMRGWPLVDVQFGQVVGNLWGRLVAISFALIAARYYANIYAMLQYHGNDWRGHAANVTMRVNSFSYFLPIMVAIAIDPKLWPYCAGFGTIFPSLNNYFCYTAARASQHRARTNYSVERLHDSEPFLSRYREWSVMMAAYCIIIALIGVGLLNFSAVQHGMGYMLAELGLSGVRDQFFAYRGPQDEWVYALIVVGINLLKINRNNCGREASQIYGGLARLFSYDEKRMREKRRPQA